MDTALRGLKNKILKFIDRITELTGIDLRYIVRGGSWSAVDLIVGNGSSLLLAIAFARLLPKDIYGAYSLVLSWTGIFSIFALSGINSAVIRSVAKGFEGDMQRAIKYKLRWGLVASLISFAFAGYYLFVGNHMLAISFVIVAVFLPSYLASGVVSYFFFGKELFRQGSIMAGAVRFASLVTMIGSMFFTSYLPIILLAYFVPDTIIRTIFYFWATKKYQKNKNLSDDINVYAKHLTAMNILGGISKRLDQILLFHFIGAAEVAIYKFALMPIERITNVLMSFVGLTAPRFAKRSYHEIYQSLTRKLIWFNMFFAAIGVLAFVLLPMLFGIFFPQYSDSVYYARILLLPLVFSAPAVITSIWSAKAEIKKLYTLKVITHGLRIGSFAVLIPVYGVAGAIWSQLVISFIVGIYIYSTYLMDKSKVNRDDISEN